MSREAVVESLLVEEGCGGSGVAESWTKTFEVEGCLGIGDGRLAVAEVVAFEVDGCSGSLCGGLVIVEEQDGTGSNND